MGYRDGLLRIRPGAFRAWQRTRPGFAIITGPDDTVLATCQESAPGELENQIRQRMEELVESDQVPSPGIITAGEYHGE